MKISRRELLRSGKTEAAFIAHQKKRTRKYNLRNKYNLCTDDYDAMKKKQRGCCAICQRKTKWLCIDHCHRSQRIRGLLCAPCNQALGLMRDDMRALRRAAEYVRVRTNKRRTRTVVD